MRDGSSKMDTPKRTIKKLRSRALPGERLAKIMDSNSMESSQSDRASKTVAPCTELEAETFEDGLRSLAKLIAKAILRARQAQTVSATSK